MNVVQLNNGMLCVNDVDLARQHCNGNCTNCTRELLGLSRVVDMGGD